MEFKGTKGKWERITANWDLDQCVFVEDTEQEICTIKSEAHNQMYDAQLIAHAPEMWEMLETVLKDYHNIIPQSEARDNRMRQIKDLLTRATTI